ncbi:Crp/Fnr family transcriptional regulator [Candidatus Acetothermia bacterium]|nr:Crp/Fnr family transcriptional regulator [Candidatus Acetothermia bacterium]MCI2428655.1 Crp/Fnr family transcriptional regulator [Candidatus Acetothermia bacterium]
MSFNKGETIYQPGDPSSCIYVVEQGRVKLAYLDDSGKKLTVAIVDQGKIFGEMCLVGEKTRKFLAIAVEETIVRRIGCNQVWHLLNRNPAYLLELVELFGARIQEIGEIVENLAFKDLQTRLSRQLLKLAGEHGVQTENGILIGLQLTHQELADMIGSARENTTLALNQFVREGILDKSRYRIIIKNQAKLKERCQVAY